MTTSPARLACAFVPLFPLAARLRSEPSLRDQAVAIFQGNGNAARLVAATRVARRAGLKPGMTPPEARAILPNLLVRARDPESELAASEALLDTAGLFSPRVEATGEGCVTLDLTGLERLKFGSGDGGSHERDLANALVAALEKAGLPARVGVAGSRLAARIASHLPASPTLVPSGEEARFLSPLPLARLGPELDVATTLARWGLRVIGDLAKLPPADVASRLGETGRRLHALARGADAEPFVPRLVPPVFTEGMSLEWPVVTLEPFLAFLASALTRLTERLAGEALGCARLEITMDLEPEGHDTRAIDLPAPTRDVKTLLELLRLNLDGHPPGAAVVTFALTAHPDRPRPGQLTLFGPAEVSPDRLATALARLLALLGEGRVGAPAVVSGHRPERHALVPFAPPPAPLTRPAPREGRGLLAVRVLRPAVPLEVLTEETAGAGAARLLSLRSVAPSGAPPALEIQGAVRVAAGPWRLEEGWWEEKTVDRDYWDVELEGGGLYRVFRERESQDWFADGIYD